ncbi:MAG TPA: hypothetical protein VFH27_16790 [Longimicrobiaceae bacterium]|nr:hypothetical protein [Longimicrobiaceae bacterium]
MSSDPHPFDPAAAGARMRDAAERLERAVNEAPVLDHVPGRSLTLAGVGVMAVAIVLSWLPGWYGVGLPWSVLMLALGAAVAVRELKAAGREVSGAERLPPVLGHPLLPPAFAALVALHALRLLGFGIVQGLWLVAALLLGYDQYRRAAASRAGLAGRWDLRQAWRGNRRWIALGVGLCVLSLFFTWASASGHFTGGRSYNYAYRSDSNGNSGYAYGWDYNPVQSYWPGYDMSGRNQGLVMLAMIALLALLLWAASRRSAEADGSAPRKASPLVPGLLLGFLFLWWWTHAENGAGVWMFALGWAMTVFGVVRLSRGEEEGRWDPAHLLARVRGKRDHAG